MPHARPNRTTAQRTRAQWNRSLSPFDARLISAPRKHPQVNGRVYPRHLPLKWSILALTSSRNRMLFIHLLKECSHRCTWKFLFSFLRQASDQMNAMKKRRDEPKEEWYWQENIESSSHNRQYVSLVVSWTDKFDRSIHKSEPGERKMTPADRHISDGTARERVVSSCSLAMRSVLLLNHESLFIGDRLTSAAQEIEALNSIVLLIDNVEIMVSIPFQLNWAVQLCTVWTSNARSYSRNRSW